MGKRHLEWLVWVPVVLAVSSCGGSAPGPTVPRVFVEVSQSLTGTGNNYDDPCFWQDPGDPGRAVGCITSKDRRHVECFDLSTGDPLDEPATGFEGEANNCAIDGNEMATTDNGAQVVRIHELPTMRLVRSVVVAGAGDLGGVCFARSGGRRVLFVTDEATNRVLEVDAENGDALREWEHGLSEAEAIACDDDWQRVIVCDDRSEGVGCRAFGYDGTRGADFGADVLGTDAEGVAVYRCGAREGYVIVSDQGHSEFEVFRREDFGHVCTFVVKKDADLTHDTDGIDVLQSSAYPDGLFGACDECSPGPGDELDLVPWPAIAAACGLRVCSVEGAR